MFISNIYHQYISAASIIPTYIKSKLREYNPPTFQIRANPRIPWELSQTPWRVHWIRPVSWSFHPCFPKSPCAFSSLRPGSKSTPMLSYLDFNLPGLARSWIMNLLIRLFSIFSILREKSMFSFYICAFILIHKSNSEPLLYVYFVKIVDRIRSSISWGEMACQ